MRDIINKFTCGHPKHMIKPVLLIFIENFFMSFPAIAVYFAINIIVLSFDNPKSIDLKSLWVVAGFMGAIMLVQLALSTITFLGTFLPATIHSAENKKAFVKKLRTLPLGYFQEKQSGELINTFTGDFLAIEQSMVGVFTGIFSVVFSCILTSVFMFIFNPTMAAALYISIPVAALVIALSMNTTAKLSKRNIQAKDKTATFLNEYLLGMKTLKSYNQTGKGFDKLKRAYEHLMSVNIKSEVVGGSFMNFASTLVRVGLPLMCFAGAYLLLGGKLSIVDYLALIIVGTKIISPLVTWVQYMVQLRSKFVSADRIDKVMKSTAMSGKDKTVADGDIVFDNVTFSYSQNGKKVLENASFTIPNGKLTAIVGTSGGGKSTILRLIARFWDVGGGAIYCCGKELKSLNCDKWISNISMVLQDVYLFHDTIRENILFGRRTATEEEIIEAAKKAGCHEFISALPEGYDTMVGEGGSTLSGGEKQRISIARAILKNAPVLLLDEPTASLDAKNEVLVQNAISELVKGKTVVMIAHRLKTVQNAHQILVVDGGGISESGTHDELIAKNGIYNRLWTLQNQSLDWEF